MLSESLLSPLHVSNRVSGVSPYPIGAKVFSRTRMLDPTQQNAQKPKESNFSSAVNKGRIEPCLPEFDEIWGPSYGYGYGELTKYGKDGSLNKPGQVNWKTARCKATDGKNRELPHIVDEEGSKYWLLPLTPSDFWRLWRDENKAVGVRPWGHTRYVMVDLDAGGRYHPHEDNGKAAQGILKAAEDIGLEGHLKLQSSASEGCWLFWPLPEKVKSYQAAKRLKEALQTAGHVLTPGHLEIFPNLKSRGAIYNMHRVPLQQGSYLLDDDWQPYSYYVSAFMWAWERAAACQDLDLFLSEPKLALPKMPRSQKPKVSFNLASRMEWTGRGQSNQNIGALVAYVVEIEKLRISKEIESRVLQLMEERGYYKWASKTEQRDRNHVQRWIRTKLRRDSGYTGKRGGNTNPNEVKATAATKRLEVALAELVDRKWRTSNELFQAVCEVLKEKFGMGISKQTWQDRKALWQGMLESFQFLEKNSKNGDRTQRECN